MLGTLIAADRPIRLCINYLLFERGVILVVLPRYIGSFIVTFIDL